MTVPHSESKGFFMVNIALDGGRFNALKIWLQRYI